MFGLGDNDGSRSTAARALATVLLLAGTGLQCSGIGTSPDATVDVSSHGNVGKTMARNSVKFEQCGRDSVSVQTGSAQTLELRFTVTPDGQVRNAEVESMSVPDPDLQGCVLTVLKKLKFPPPKDGKPKNISYPLTVKPE